MRAAAHMLLNAKCEATVWPGAAQASHHRFSFLIHSNLIFMTPLALNIIQPGRLRSRRAMNKERAIPPSISGILLAHDLHTGIHERVPLIIFGAAMLLMMYTCII